MNLGDDIPTGDDRFAAYSRWQAARGAALEAARRVVANPASVESLCDLASLLEVERRARAEFERMDP